ncbi:hypothetical protein AB1484_31940 [Parafrankia sp. FMc6]|uniref:hypothetical protein n=1 Tax=Parafrankia soli TaxID=2599596 RepID=UPI0034D39C2E
MIPRTAVPAAVLTPTALELDDARAQIDRLAGGGYAASYGAFGAVASGQAGDVIRALRQGDLEAAARGLRILAAADLAACELRDRLAGQAPEGDPDPSLGGLDEVVTRQAAIAADPEHTPVDRARAAGRAEGIQRTAYVLTGKQIWTESGR